MTRRLIVAAMLVAASLTSAHAQPRAFGGTIASGWFATTLQGGSQRTSFELHGNGFDLIAAGVDVGAVHAAIDCPSTGCRSGDAVRLSAYFANDDMGEGTATVNGETLAPAYFSGGGFRFEAGIGTIPRGNRKHLVLSAPFTLVLEAPFSVYDEPGARTSGGVEALWAQGNLAGSGTVSVFFERQRIGGDWSYAAQQVVYTFRPLRHDA